MRLQASGLHEQEEDANGDEQQGTEDGATA
jgi:hypothetical protein